MYIKFVNRKVNFAWAIGYGWDPKGYKDTLKSKIKDIIFESRTKEMLKKRHIVDINIFPTFKDWKDYQEDRLSIDKKRERLLNLIYQFSDEFQSQLAENIRTEEDIRKIIHAAFSKNLLSLGEYIADEDIEKIINDAIANENMQDFGLKWFRGKNGIRNISELYDAINYYNNEFTPKGSVVQQLYDPVGHYTEIESRVKGRLEKIREFHVKHQQYIKLPDIGETTHINQIHELEGQYRKSIKILNKHVFYMELITLLFGREFKTEYTGICFTKEKDHTEYYASLNGKLHDIGTLEKIIEIFHSYSTAYSRFEWRPDTRKWFKQTFLNTSRNQTWVEFKQEFATKLSENMKDLNKAREASNELVGQNESTDPKFNDDFDAMQDITCPTIGS
jgi:hypothetical protein